MSLHYDLATFYRRVNEYSFLSCQNKPLRLNHGNRFKIALCFSTNTYYYPELNFIWFSLFLSLSGAFYPIFRWIKAPLRSLTNRFHYPFAFYYHWFIALLLESFFSFLLIVQILFGRVLMFMLAFTLTYTHTLIWCRWRVQSLQHESTWTDLTYHSVVFHSIHVRLVCVVSTLRLAKFSSFTAAFEDRNCVFRNDNGQP